MGLRTRTAGWQDRHRPVPPSPASSSETDRPPPPPPSVDTQARSGQMSASGRSTNARSAARGCGSVSSSVSITTSPPPLSPVPAPTAVQRPSSSPASMGGLCSTTATHDARTVRQQVDVDRSRAVAAGWISHAINRPAEPRLRRLHRCQQLHWAERGFHLRRSAAPVWAGRGGAGGQDLQQSCSAPARQASAPRRPHSRSGAGR